MEEDSRECVVVLSERRQGLVAVCKALLQGNSVCVFLNSFLSPELVHQYNSIK